MKNIDNELLDQLCAEAAQSPRKRSHRLLHDGDADTVQRLLIAVQPGTVVPPHHHAAPMLWESHVCLRGAYDILMFDDQGSVTERYSLGQGAGTALLEVDGSRWHALIATQADTVLLEFKPGPFNPDAAKFTAEFAPLEGEEGAEHWEQWARTAQVCERYVGQ
ncbi:MAG: WbuC family cupin fold metalloprotein [Gammaproteobacteria bacterium]